MRNVELDVRDVATILVASSHDDLLILLPRAEDMMLRFISSHFKVVRTCTLGDPAQDMVVRSPAQHVGDACTRRKTPNRGYHPSK